MCVYTDFFRRSFFVFFWAIKVKNTVLGEDKQKIGDFCRQNYDHSQVTITHGL